YDDKAFQEHLEVCEGVITNDLKITFLEVKQHPNKPYAILSISKFIDLNKERSTLIKALLIKKVIESARKLVTDVNIEFTESGIKFMSMDSAHVALVSVFLESKSFEKYDYDKEETI
ncbi:2107_t:CDS:2, partial [Cetraspora pellucida]